MSGLLARVLGRTAAAGDAPMAPAAEYRRLWADAKQRTYPAVDEYERACGAAIDAEWFHQLALVTQVTIKRSELCYQHGRLLYATLARYVRERGHEQLNILETGTARGFSSLCMARALEDAGATGKIVSFDVLPHDRPMFWNCLRDAEGPSTRGDLLSAYAGLVGRYLIFQTGDTGQVLASLFVPRVHFAFLDSVHTYEHVMAEFRAVHGCQLPGDIIFFDDYTPEAYPGVVKAADEICETAGYAAHVVAASAQRRYLIAEKR